jgi:hypothetical protein
MRLGKEQAAGYVEDTEATEVGEVLTSDTERTPVAEQPLPAVAAG